jgi:hypothetical protein
MVWESRGIFLHMTFKVGISIEKNGTKPRSFVYLAMVGKEFYEVCARVSFSPVEGPLTT